MPLSEAPKITALNVRTCVVPIDPPVQTASGTVPVAPLIVIDLETDASVTGQTYLFTYTTIALQPTADLVRGLAPLVVGQRLAPTRITDDLTRRLTLLGTEGLVLMAIAGIDMAAWDALARVSHQPLCAALGGTVRPIRAYASLRSMAPDGIRAEVAAALQWGATSFKVKVGLPNIRDDIALVTAVRSVAGAEATVMVDFNQSLSPAEARRRAHRLEGLDLHWIEEPLPMADVAGQAALRQAVRTPIQGGENWWGPADAARSISLGATDHVMPDVMKIGGVTGWMRTVALAEVSGLPVSSHLFPEVSAHLLAVTPTAHMLEVLDLAAPIRRGGLALKDGHARPDEGPGAGLAFDDDAIARFA